ncbi:MAG: CBS domain-containing protein [Polyangiaceae bacterium]
MADELPKTIAELMTRKVITGRADEPIRDLREGMERYRFRHLPIVEDGKLIGLVTRSDLLHASSSWLSDRADDRDALIGKQPLGSIMQKEVLTMRAEDSLLDAARLMWEGRLGCIPIVDGEDKLVGIITATDFLKLGVRCLGGELKEDDDERKL